MIRRYDSIIRWIVAVTCAVLIVLAACKTEDNPLAPYAGSRILSHIVIQDSTLTPKITWLGGYVTVLGVNRGTAARLDSSLAWLVYQSGDNVHFPVTYGSLPSGAQDLTTSFGGHVDAKLLEDHEYTFWVMKGDAWQAIQSHPNESIVVDSAATTAVQERNDSLFVSPNSNSILAKMVDAFTNVKNVRSFGGFATITVTQSDTCNFPNITFHINTTGQDSTVSAIGICLGDVYLIGSRIWEVVSADVQPDTTIYWLNDVVPSPLRAGQVIPGTAAFVSLPLTGIPRGYNCYLWIANKNWDRTTRLRSTPYYAYALFTTW